MYKLSRTETFVDFADFGQKVYVREIVKNGSSAKVNVHKKVLNRSYPQNFYGMKKQKKSRREATCPLCPCCNVETDCNVEAKRKISIFYCVLFTFQNNII